MGVLVRESRDFAVTQCRYAAVRGDVAFTTGPPIIRRVVDDAPQRDLSKSRAAFKAASRIIPGGVNSPLYGATAGDGCPVFMVRGQGAVLTDLDGHTYVDYNCARGSLLLGHADERVVVAIDKAASRGFSFGAPTEAELKLAELIAGKVPAVEQLRLVNSATEAAAAVLRLARGLTGRNRIVRFEGCYHGFIDALIGGRKWSPQSAPDDDRAPGSAGVPCSAAADTIVLPYNDLGAFASFMEAEGTTVAAVLVEPVAARMGVVAPADGFLAGLRQACDQHGSLLVYDEATTGFRLGPGGAVPLFEVTPDLVIYGTIVGGGLPLAAYGGLRSVMSPADRPAPIFQPGTLAGNPLAVVAGIATLQAASEEGFYESLEQKGARLEEGLRAAAAEAGSRVWIARVGSMLSLLFCEGPVTNWDAAAQADAHVFERYRAGMLENGVFLPPVPGECLFLSAAHSDEDIEQTIETASQALRLAADSAP